MSVCGGYSDVLLSGEESGDGLRSPEKGDKRKREDSDNDDDDIGGGTFSGQVASNVKLFRKWAFTVNCEKLKDARMNDVSYYVEGSDLSVATNKHGKTTKQTIYIGPLEPKEEDKKDPYAHRHCAVHSTAGSISKMNAIRLLAKFLNIRPDKFTCGIGNVITYSQPVQRWPDYKKYMYKTLKGRDQTDECVLKQAVTFLRRKLQKNPVAKEVKEYLIKNDLMSIRKVATMAIKQQIDLLCDIGDIFKSSDEEKSPEKESGAHFLNRLLQISDAEPIAPVSSVTFYETVLPVMLEQLMQTSIDGKVDLNFYQAIEVICLQFMPLLLKRDPNDHETLSLLMYGESGTGKSFVPMSLCKFNRLHLICGDAAGVGRFDANTAATGYFFDEAKDDFFTGRDAGTIKNLTAGDETSIKVYSKSARIRGWVVVTAQHKLLYDTIDRNAWKRRILRLSFLHCQPVKTFVDSFDLSSKRNIEEILTFLYNVLHMEKNNNGLYIDAYKCEFIANKYYTDIIDKQFAQLEYGQCLLDALKSQIGSFKNMYS